MVLSYSVVPGPTSVPSTVLQAFSQNYGSSDLEDDFWEDYFALEKNLQQILGTQAAIVVQGGEGMVALWGSMKSILQPQDCVLAISNGLYGEGFADMARQLGANVIHLSFPSIIDTSAVLEAIAKHRPHVVTMVHCETPIGVLNDLKYIGKAVHANGEGLFLVDCVSSAGGVPVQVDEMEIDLGLVASHKVFSAPPMLAFTSVSGRAWKKIQKVKYQGYDALLPFVNVHQERFLPYTHSWHAIAATKRATDFLLEEGLTHSYKRHRQVQAFCISEGEKIGLRIVANRTIASPTCTAFWIPEGITWKELKQSLVKKQVLVGGSYGEHAERVFRIGHMGTQADMDLVKKVMEIIGETLAQHRPA